MAKKDTQKALEKRGVSEEISAILLSKYSSLTSIKTAKDSDLEELGLDKEQIDDIMEKLGGREDPAAVAESKAKKKSASKSKKAVEEIEPQEPIEPVLKRYQLSENEKRLKDLADSMGVELPLKLIVDIAARLNVSDEAIEAEVKQILENASRMYGSRMIVRNESVGVMAAHSLGEPGTQMNMRTFHHAGVANVSVTQGLPRLLEIVDARRVPSTPSMNIPLAGLAAMDENVAKRIASEIEITTLEDIASVEVDVTNLRIVIRPDLTKLSEKGIEIDAIVDRLNKVKAVKGLVKKVDIGEKSKKSAVREEGHDIIITPADLESPFKKIQAMYDAVKKAKIKGVDGIKRAVISRENGRWSIVTEGSNLKEVLNSGNDEYIDKDKVATNSILEIAEVLGIEAARNSLIGEAYKTLQGGGLDVDVRHIMLVADMMTNDGDVKAIGRHGISGKKVSVLSRAAFELTAPNLLEAAIQGEVDHLEGVTENIIVGQPITLGTGAVNIIYNPKKSE